MQDIVCVPKKLVTAKVVSKTQVAAGHFQMGLSCPYIAKGTNPGQFIQVQVNRSYDPLLFRPLAVYLSDGDVFDILFKAVGRGTGLLAEKDIGDTLDIMGPLGNCFPFYGDFQTGILVAGGMGIAALMSLAQAIKDRRIIAMLGASTAKKIVGDKDLLAIGADVRIATDDGSAGYKGMVPDILDAALGNEADQMGDCRIFACGPSPMLKVVAQIASRRKVPAYVSLEERMACGIGACLGCACQVVSPQGETKYKMVCTDGPVFEAQEIVWK